MLVFAYISSILIGVSLGLIGAGGSILTVPVLVYLFGVEPVMATAYSLFIVGVSSLIAVFPKYKQHLISIKTAIVFGIPSIVAIFITRKYLLPAIPNEILIFEAFHFTKAAFLMSLFAVLMIIASFSMLFERKEKKKLEEEKNKIKQEFNYPFILLEGTIVGVLTGLVGAGGGFLIIPALVMLSKLPMKMAIGTSLLIVAAKSLIGFLGDVSSHAEKIDWTLLGFVTLLSISGIFIGNNLSKKIDGEKLKKGFAWFILVMGIYIVFKELYFDKV